MVLDGTVCLRQLAGEYNSEEIRFGRFLANDAVTVDRVIVGLERPDPVCGGWPARLGAAGHQRDQVRDDAGQSARPGQGQEGHLLGPAAAPHARARCRARFLPWPGERAGVDAWGRRAAPARQSAVEPEGIAPLARNGQAAKPVLARASMVTFIADRESDLYMMWARVPDGGFHLLSRVMTDRALTTGGTLRRAVQEVAFRDTQVIELRERAGRPARQAKLCLLFGEATIKRPKNLREDGLPEGVTLRWVEAVERAAPEGVEPLHWRLLTTHQVSSLAQAWQIVAWYKQRWVISSSSG